MIFPIPNMLQDTLHFQAVDFIKPKNQHPKDHTICALHQQSRWQRVVETRWVKILIGSRVCVIFCIRGYVIGNKIVTSHVT
jgi:hypothetical protein